MMSFLTYITGFFYELWTFVYFDRLCKLEKRGDEIKKISSPLKLLSQSQPNFAEIILGWSPFKIVSVSAVLYPKWSPLLKIKISSNGQNCSILSQKVRKFELYKHNDELFNIYSWLSLSRIRLTRISGWVKFLSKSRTSLCINIYNLTPVESNSDESKFRLSRIKVLVPRCRKPYYLHPFSQIYLSKHVYYLRIKIGS